MNGSRRDLEELAVHFGVDLFFHDVEGTRYDASDAALLAVLRSLHAELGDDDDVVHALTARKNALVREVLEPVVVLWSDRPQRIVFRLREQAMDKRWSARLVTASGDVFENSGVVHDLEFFDEWFVDGTKYIRKGFAFPSAVPTGYHRLTLEVDSASHEAFVISAPGRAYVPDHDRMWGVFAPTYALRIARDRGIGHLGALEDLRDHVRRAGGQFVGTLPLTATFLDEPFEPSPYAPVSRLFFNELFLDVDRLPELPRSTEARAILESSVFVEEVADLRAQPRVDYRRQAVLQNRLLEALAKTAFANGTPEGLSAWVDDHPRVKDYAAFRAATTANRATWPMWSPRMRDGHIEASDYDRATYDYHTYVQWRLAEQLDALCTDGNDAVGLYLDLPLGVHPDGYDAWRERDVFLEGVSTGAPPDALFNGGQDWGFRPLDPERSRRTEYRYIIDCLRQQLRIAGALRIDHVMGLERLYCIPPGMTARDGVYVHHRSEEQYAILTLESQRHRTMIVGEDLGTVPNEVRAAMERHAFQRMYVMQFSIGEDPPIRPAPHNSVGSMNTHDTPTFTGFWEGHEIDVRVALGHTTAEDGEAEHEGRRRMRTTIKKHLFERGLVKREEATTKEVLGALLQVLADSPAKLVFVNLDDLFLERGAQNVPGTTTEHPNWQRRMATDLEEAFSSAHVQALLARVRRE